MKSEVVILETTHVGRCDSNLGKEPEERTSSPGQSRECGRCIFRRADQFWDTNTSNLLYGLQNTVCVLQVDATLRATGV